MSNKLFHSKSERRGCFVLLCALVFILGIVLWMNTHPIKPEEAHSLEAQNELNNFEKQLIADSIEWARNNRSKWETKQRVIETFPFDPNSADSITLIRLGLYPWQAKAMRKYREKGGRWKNAEDFRRLYGLSTADYLRLKPYIRIEPSLSEIQHLEKQVRYDSLKRIYHSPQKLTKGAKVDLNTADTTLFKQIPGIGSYYARKICNYREALGGFVSLSQVNEITDLPSDIGDWLSFSPHPIKRILINKASFKVLVRHPYLNYEQVKEIVNYIRQNGSLHSWQDLRFSKHFSQADFARLEPYFEF